MSIQSWIAQFARMRIAVEKIDDVAEARQQLDAANRAFHDLYEEWQVTPTEMQEKSLLEYEYAQRDFHTIGTVLTSKIHPPLLFGRFDKAHNLVNKPADATSGALSSNQSNIGDEHKMDCEDNSQQVSKELVHGMQPNSNAKSVMADEQQELLLSRITMDQLTNAIQKAVDSALKKPIKEDWTDAKPLQNLCMATYKEQWELQKSLFALEKQTSLSAMGITKVINTIDEVMKQFQSKGYEWSAQTTRVTIMHIISVLDKVTQDCWRYRITVENPSFESLINFLNERKFDATIEIPVGGFRIQKMASPQNHLSRPVEQAGTSTARSRSNSKSSTSMDKRCSFCGKKHVLKDCPTFLKLSLEERECQVSKLKLCKRCFSNAHNTAHCASAACKECAKKHHPLLHHR